MQDRLRKHFEEIIRLSDGEFELVLSHFKPIKAKKHEFLIEEGKRVEFVYFVVSGLVKLTYTDDSGRESIVSFAMEDWWESDYQAFYSRHPASMSLQCLENTEVYCLSLENYRNLCKELHKMEHFFLEKANRGHIASQQRIISFLTLSAKERYGLLLKRYPSLLQRVSKTLLASYLGVSRETLSRLSS
tara:strand:+ start:107344 stop:107907 length:564 start_codon:yes stop_codon:yes gene_type:complete